MNASAFCDLWAQVMFWKFSKLHELQASAIWKAFKTSRVTIKMHEHFMQFFVYYILNKVTP